METETETKDVERVWLRLLREPNHDPALKLPPYMILMSGRSGRSGEDGYGLRFFSKECGIAILDEFMEDDGVEVDVDLASVIRGEILGASLPVSATQADRFFSKEYSEEDQDDGLFARIIGASPSEEGSGKARYELRTGQPSGTPVSGSLFVNGIALPALSAHFSQERAIEEIYVAFDEGLISEAEREVVIAQARAVGLPEKLSQIDRIIQTKDMPYARFLLGVDQAEEGSGQASVKLCERTQIPHAHLYMRGRRERDRTELLSVTSARSRIDEMYEQGYFTEDEAIALNLELVALGLPATVRSDPT